MSLRRFTPILLPYNERDPLLDNPTAKTPPPSYYACTSTFEETLPSYQEAATGVLGIQDSETHFLFPEARPKTYGRIAAVAFFCCCFSPLACIALYYSARVKDYYESGQYDKAKQASQRTLTCSSLAIVFGLLILLLISSTLFCVFYTECKSTIIYKLHL